MDKQIGPAEGAHFFLASFSLGTIVALTKLAMMSCLFGKDAGSYLFALAANSTMALAVFGGLLAADPSYWPLIIGATTAFVVAAKDAAPVVQTVRSATVGFFKSAEARPSSAHIQGIETTDVDPEAVNSDVESATSDLTAS